MASPRTQAASISDKSIANSLTVDYKFTVNEFADATGIKLGSSYARIKRLLAADSIGIATVGKNYVYFMTKAHKEKMIAGSIESKKKPKARLSSDKATEKANKHQGLNHLVFSKAWV